MKSEETGKMCQTRNTSKLMHSLGIIEDNLTKAEGLLGKLSLEKRRLNEHRRAMNADTALMSRTILQLEAGIKAEVANAQKNAETVDMSQIKKIRQTVAKLNAKIKENNEAVSGEISLMQSLTDAEKAIKRALSFAKKKMSQTKLSAFFPQIQVN